MAVRIGNKTYDNAANTGMGAQADTEPDPTDPNEPVEQAQGEAPEGEGEGGQVSKEAANYRRSMGRNCCGTCTHFAKEGDQATGSCTKVEGDITPYGLSDYWENTGNPFGPASPEHRLRKAQRRLLRAQQRVAAQSQGAPDQTQTQY